MSRADRIFRRLLRLFPADFRGDFGDDMAATFSDQRRDALEHGGSMAALRLWWETLHGILTTAPREHKRRQRRLTPFTIPSFTPLVKRPACTGC